MESNYEDIGSLVFTLVCLAGLSYLFYSSWKKKNLKLNSFAQGLNAKPIDSGVIGKYGSFEYILHIEEGHPGGAASGPTRAGYPTALRIIVEKSGINKFCLRSNDKLETKDKLETAAQTLFDYGFKEIDYDGITLDIKLYPYSLNSPVSAKYIKNILPTVAQIVEEL